MDFLVEIMQSYLCLLFIINKFLQLHSKVHDYMYMYIGMCISLHNYITSQLKLCRMLMHRYVHCV